MIGTPLFIRRKNGLELTRAGELLKRRVIGYTDEWKSILDEVRGAELLPKGHYFIGAHTSVASYALPKFLPKLTRDYEMIRISLLHGSSSEILESVISSRIDFGLVINPKRHLDLVIKKLCEDKYTFWKSPQCLNEGVLILNPNVAQNETVISKFETKRQFARRLETSSFEVAAQLIENGTGIGLLPERIARLHSLQIVDKTIFFLDTLCLCFRQDKQKSAGAKAIIEAIVTSKI